MRVGTLEIQIMAGMARLQKDMNDAQRVVGGAMGNVERSVASAKRAMQTLGVGLPIAAITDQVRRMTDQYTKLDAQIRLATKSQSAYAQGMADIRRISSVAQADISATSMLYTRLMNVMDGTGVSQQKLATVTETVSFGLKAYGATTQEAASAALQLSQAMGANRLGGEEFRAVMEAMPNVMKVLADSMGVPLGSLRQLSIDGKITADEMVKAFGNPAVAAQFKALAMSTQTVTGAWQVARNELMLLVGEFSKSSGLTSSAIAAFDAFAAVFRFMADNMDLLTRALGAYAAVLVGKFVVGLVEARVAQMALNAAHVEAVRVNTALAATEAANALAARDAAAARAFDLAGTAALNAAKAEAVAVNLSLAQAEAAEALAAQKQAAAKVLYLGTTPELIAANARLSASELAVARAEEAAALTAKDVAFSRGVATGATNTLTAANARLALATEQVARAEATKAASSVTIMGRIKGIAGKAGWIGMALFGAWTVYDFLNGMQQVADGADKLKNKFEGLSLAEVQMARQKELIRQIGMRGFGEGTFNAKAIRTSQDTIRAYDAQIAKMVELQNAETAAQRVKIVSNSLSHDQQVMQARMIELADQFNNKQMTEAEYLTRVNEALHGKVAATKHVAATQEPAILKHLSSLREEILLYGMSTEAVARYNAEKAGGNVIQQEQAVADTQHLEYLKDAQRQVEANDALKKRADERAAQRAQDAIDEQTKAHEDMWKSIEGVAHDTWTKVWEGGRNAFQNIGKTIKSAILDLLYQMTVQKWIVNVGVSATGGTGSSTGGALSSLTGGAGGSWLQAGQTLWSAFSGGMTGTLGSLAMSAGEMFGSAALTSFGTGMSSTLGAGMAGPTMAGAGGMAGAGAAIGAALPWVAAALVVGSLLDTKSKGATGPTTLGGQFSDQGFSGAYRTPWYQSGGLFSASGGGVDVQQLAQAQIDAFSSAVVESQRIFDSFATSIGVGTTALDGWVFAFDRVVTDEKAAIQLMNDMADSMGNFLIPVVGNFRREGESLADTAKRLTETVITTDAIFKLMGRTLDTVGVASLNVRQSLIDAFGGASQASTAMQAYYAAFYSDNERAIAGWQQMSAMLRSIGVDIMPTTNEAFRALVESQDLATTAGQKTFAALVSLAPTFDGLTKATSTLEQQTAGLTSSLAQLSTAGFSTLVDYTRALRLRAGAGAAATPGIAERALAAQAAQVVTTVGAGRIGAAGTGVVYSAINPNPALVGARDAAMAAANADILAAQDRLARVSDSEAGQFTRMALARSANAAIAAAQAKLDDARAMPTFAAGGVHTGGWRMVGENGPEVEYTGPSSIVSNSDSKKMLDNSGVIASIDALRTELRAVGIAIAVPAQKTHKILDRWDGQGMPEVREAA